MSGQMQLVGRIKKTCLALQKMAAEVKTDSVKQNSEHQGVSQLGSCHNSQRQ